MLFLKLFLQEIYKETDSDGFSEDDKEEELDKSLGMCKKKEHVSRTIMKILQPNTHV